MTDRPRRTASAGNRRNHYRTLHVQPDAPVAIIKANYRTLMQTLKLHPDLGGDHQAAVAINAAYDVLSHSARRAAYDRELFARYDLARVAEGPLPGRTRRQGVAHRSLTANERNHYRLLQVQPDAPIEVIEASYRALSASPTLRALLAEAMVTLRDPRKRAAYDRSLALARRAAPDRPTPQRSSSGSAATGYEPLATPVCAFCSMEHRATRSMLEPLGCMRCGSPLFAPDAGMADAIGRINRSPRHDAIAIYTSWPGTQARATLSDLSPAGLRLATTSPLAMGNLVKVDGPHLQAVGKVVHCRREAGITSAGLSFLTVGFGVTRGSFFSARA